MTDKKKTPSAAATTNKGSLKIRLYGNSSRTQRARILRYFREEKPRLTVSEAREILGIMVVRPRIHELRVDEYDRNGVKHRNGQYVYHGMKSEVVGYEK